jgi:anti-anti-sigma factor
MNNDQINNELVLQGAALHDNEKFAELVVDFKSQLAKTPGIPVVLDLCALTNIHSRGIGIILGIFKECKASNRDFRIITATNEVLNLFKLLKLDKVISVQKVEK